MLCKFLWSQDLAEATRSCVGNGVGGKQQLPVYCGEHGYLLVIPIPGCQTVTMEQRNLGALSLGPWEMSQEPNSKSQEKNGNTTPHRCQPEHNKAIGSHKAVHVLNSRLHRGHCAQSQDCKLGPQWLQPPSGQLLSERHYQWPSPPGGMREHTHTHPSHGVSASQGVLIDWDQRAQAQEASQESRA